MENDMFTSHEIAEYESWLDSLERRGAEDRELTIMENNWEPNYGPLNDFI